MIEVKSKKKKEELVLPITRQSHRFWPVLAESKVCSNRSTHRFPVWPVFEPSFKTMPTPQLLIGRSLLTIILPLTNTAKQLWR